ncbi:MAG: hypothetical protein IJH34_03080 [Romboutsia sp.]|nr:hypothetical protein [Romboutsia sp.]
MLELFKLIPPPSLNVALSPGLVKFIAPGSKSKLLPISILRKHNIYIFILKTVGYF